jgi:acyl dehydratase
MQTRIASLVEAVTNALTGYGTTAALWMLTTWALDPPINVGQTHLRHLAPLLAGDATVSPRCC